jgi:hypothetical protein
MDILLNIPYLFKITIRYDQMIDCNKNKKRKHNLATNINRRDFLRIGVLGSLTLAVGSSFHALSIGYAELPPLSGRHFLREQDAEFLLAIAPAVLNENYPGSLGDKAAERLIKSLDKMMLTFSQFSQSQLFQLFDLMSVAPLRYFAGGPFVAWSKASRQQVDDYLIGWQQSSLSLKRVGYSSLCKLITMTWYSQPENYIQSGYPGPPKVISNE